MNYSKLKSERFPLYVAISFLVTIVAISKQYYEYEQFFPTFVKLVEWNIGKVVLVNFAICLLFICCKIIILLFFSKLRDYETDKIYERFFFNLVEFCITLTIFRVEFNRDVTLLYLMVQTVRSFHTIATLRIRYMESQRIQTKFLYFKRFVFLFILLVFNFFMLNYFYVELSVTGITYKIIFFQEFLILIITMINNIIRYSSFLYNLFNKNKQWENKGEFIFYLEIFCDVCKSFTYIVFFVLVYQKFGLPFHLIRDMYSSIIRVYRRINELVKYRKISMDFNERFPDATEEELKELDTVCNICLQEMKKGTAKKLICSHIFHSECLKGWFAHNQKCPICSQNLSNPAERKRRIGGRRGGNQQQQQRQNQNQNQNPQGRRREDDKEDMDNEKEEKVIKIPIDQNAKRNEELMNSVEEILVKNEETGEEEEIEYSKEKMREVLEVLNQYFKHNQVMNIYYSKKIKEIITKKKD